MPTSFHADTVLTRSFALALPEVVLIAAACLLFLGGTFRQNRHLWAGFALVALGVALAFLLRPPFDTNLSPREPFNGPLFLDPLATLTAAVAFVGGVVLVLFSWNEVPDRHAAEYYGCLLVSLAGLALTGAANDLVTIFLALELISIPTYILLYLPRAGTSTQEAAIKYFLLSIFSSGLFLFGLSYLYGLTGTTYLPDVLRSLAGPSEGAAQPTAAARGMVLVAAVMVLAGLGFCITAVSFHFYAPDVYQGAPTVGAAFLAFLPKTAGFVAMLRLLGFVVEGTTSKGLAGESILGDHLPTLLWILAAVTMTVGNVLALLQNNIKRLLAYSSIAHAGYMLIGLAVAPVVFETYLPGGLPAVLFYLVAYGAMTVGAFAVVAYLNTSQRPVETVDDLAGLSQDHPGLALLMMLFLFSLLGLPLTAGFAGKLLLFFAALEVPVQNPSAPLFRWLVLIAAINSAIGGWYYLRMVAVMYLRSPLRPFQAPRAWPGLVAIGICALVTLGFGIYPKPLLDLVQIAAGRPPIDGP